MRVLKKSAITGICILPAFLLLATASCVREDVDKCMQYGLNVRAVDAEGNDLTRSGALQKADVYLFNENGFVRMVPAGASSDFLFGHDRSERLTLVAWGNLKEDTLITTGITRGTSIARARLKLKEHAQGNCLPLTDLFYCRKELGGAATRGMREETLTLVMERMAAGLSIRTRYLAERYPHDGKPCTLIVRGTGTEVDFMGETAGEGAGYRPLSVTDEKGDVYAQPFRIFPTAAGECIEIDIYRGQERLCTVSRDNDFKPLCAPAGKHTNIEIDFRYAEIRAFVSVLPWGEVNQDAEM